MSGNLPSILIASLFMGIGILAAVSILVRLFMDRYAPVKTVKAVVIGKNKVETFSKYSGNGRNEKYVVVFSAEGRKKSFYVSRFSFDGYRVNEKGALKYKGGKLIAFE